MYNQVSALATYAGQLQFDAEDNPKWAMMDVNLGSQDEPLYVQAFIKQPEIVREMKQYLIDYNINRKLWFEGSIECDAGNMVIYIRKLLLLEKFYTRQELERYKRGSVDFSDD